MAEADHPSRAARMPAAPRALAGAEVARLLAALDARACPLGPMRDWPAALRTAVRLILPVDMQMAIFWGPKHIAFYNDAYAPVIGDKHPRVLGRPAREGWAESWDDLEPLLEQVLATGEAVSEKNRAFFIERHGGGGEVAYFDYSFSPVLDDRGETGGVLCVFAETTDRVRAVRDVAEERARLAEMFDQSPSFMAVLRQPGHVIELANESFMQVVGRRDVLGRPVSDLLPELTPGQVGAFFDEVVATKRPWRGSGVRVAFARGPGEPPQERYVDLVLQPITDRAGAVEAVFVDGSDVTERVRTEERLLLSSETLRLAAEAAEVGIWDLDPRTGALNWSELTKAHFGISPLVAVSMDDFHAGLHQDDLEATTEAFAAALDPERRAAYDVEYRTIGAEDGVERWIAARGRAMFDEDGRCVRAVGTTVDITARKRAEAVLRESEARFQLLADSVPALMWISDAQGQVLFANRWFETLLGKSLDDLRDDGWLSIIHPEDREGVAAMNADAFVAQRPVSGENRLIDRDGRERWMRMEARPRLIDGRFMGYVGCAVDVTDAHLAAEALEARVAERTAELRQEIAERERVEAALHQMQRLEAVGQLTSGIAHDFNNLLTVVIGNTGMVERAASAAGLDGRTMRRLENIRTAAERGAALTQQLLAFSRRQRLSTRPLDLNATVTGMRPLFEGAIGNAITVELDLSPDLWPALTDATQIELVILNLAINARDAMEVGGTISIRTANVTRAEPTRPEHPPAGEHVMVCVADTGTGMPEEVLAHVFEPFFTTKPVGKGSGLGLAQVFGFAKQSGGGVSIDSRPGEGTEVCVFLPRAEAAPAPSGEAGAEPAGSDLSRIAILLVDDEEAVRGVTADMLAEMGAGVVHAGGGEAALAALRDRPDIDLVLADFAMPGMNGAELARRVHAVSPGMPFLILTGYAELDAIADVPAHAVVQKPVTPEVLRERVGRALRAAVTSPASPRT